MKKYLYCLVKIYKNIFKTNYITIMLSIYAAL